MTTIARRIATALSAVAASATIASAQPFSFSTVGTFAGSACTTSSCTWNGFTLSFQNAPSANYLAPSLVDLGNFTTQQANGSTPPSAIPGDATFTLTINQTGPTVGSQAVSGSLSGALGFDPSQSSLYFIPTVNSVTIGDVVYNLVLDNNGRLNIAAPTVGANPNTTVFKANVVVPEPSTYVLLASGIAGLGLVARRRRATV